ncbi:MAG: hypothetical protein RL375_3794 [Pseudomonadota bacterium]
MRSLGGSTTTALGSGAVPIVQLLLLQFSANGGTDVALNTSTWDLVFGGVTYKGAYGLGSISAVTDAPGEIKGLQFDLSGASATAVTLALDGSDQWPGTPVVLRTAVLDPTTYAVLDAPVEWTGRGDVLSLAEDGDTAVISGTAESTAVDLVRSAPTTYTDADQQALYAGDLAFAYVVDQSDKPVVWPAKEYFYK